MFIIEASSVDEALTKGLTFFRDETRRDKHWTEEPSRNGPVRVATAPVTTVYLNPCARVLRNPVRDANPFFHLMESMWMLAGRRDVAFPARYAAQLQLYSDDSVNLNGSAYGYRWREHFGYDQLELIIAELRHDPTTRRCVLAMWDAQERYDDIFDREGRPPGYVGDLQSAFEGSKDIPCNTQVFFRIHGGALDMTVTNRSNDMVWGAYGANAVHFSFLHEYVAMSVGVEVGVYYQVANNFHIYTERPDVQRLLAAPSPLRSFTYLPCDPLLAEGESVGPSEFRSFVDDPVAYDGNTSFLRRTAARMARAHEAYKAKDRKRAMTEAHLVADPCWRGAAIEWLERRKWVEAGSPS